MYIATISSSLSMFNIVAGKLFLYLLTREHGKLNIYFMLYVHINKYTCIYTYVPCEHIPLPDHTFSNLQVGHFLVT